MATHEGEGQTQTREELSTMVQVSNESIITHSAPNVIPANIISDTVQQIDNTMLNGANVRNSSISSAGKEDLILSTLKGISDKLINAESAVSNDRQTMQSLLQHFEGHEAALMALQDTKRTQNKTANNKKVSHNVSENQLDNVVLNVTNQAPVIGMDGTGSRWDRAMQAEQYQRRRTQDKVFFFQIFIAAVRWVKLGALR